MRSRSFRTLTGLPALVAAALLVACQAPAPASPTAPPAAQAATPAAGATVAAAASPTAPAKPTPAVEQRLTGLIVGVGPNLDPWGIVSAPTNAYMNLSFETLVTLDSGKPTPVLAESWRVVNPNQWEFKLRDRRYWNGDPVTSSDVKFTFEQAKDVRVSNALGPTFVGSIDRIETPDPRTVMIYTSTPDVLLPNKISRIPVFPQRVYEQLGRDRFLMEPVGSGPYRPRTIEPQQRVVFTPSENWTGPRGNLTEITMRGVPEASTRVAALRTREGDFASTVELDQIRGFTEFAKPYFPNTPAVVTYFFDTNDPLFRDRRVRQGINHAIDRTTIVRQVLGEASKPASQPVTETTIGFNPSLPPYQYDEALARRLIAEGGYPNGFQLKVGFPATQPFYFIAAETVVPYLQRVGIRAELNGYENAVNLAGFRNNTLGPFILSIITASTYADPAISLSSLTSLPGQGSGRWSNPEFDRLFTAQNAEFDVQRREQILRDMMKLIYDEAVLAPMFNSYTIWAVSDRVGEFEVALTGAVQWLKMRRVS